MIGILTGTFDPVHEGHIAMAQAARQQCGLKEVWFLVNPDPAHKLCRASFSDRTAMVTCALMGKRGLRLAPLTPGQAARPHTLPSFLQLLAEFRPQTFQFIVGMDTIQRLDSWDDVQSVVDNTSYIAVHRPGTSTDGIGTLRRRLGALGDRLRVRVIDAPTLLSVSSSSVRDQLADGVVRPGLDPAVDRYIRRHQLYGFVSTLAS